MLQVVNPRIVVSSIPFHCFARLPTPILHRPSHSLSLASLRSCTPFALLEIGLGFGCRVDVDVLLVSWSQSGSSGRVNGRIPCRIRSAGSFDKDGARCCQVPSWVWLVSDFLKCNRSTSICGVYFFVLPATFCTTERRIACLYIQHSIVFHHNRTTSPECSRRCCLAHLHPKSHRWLSS
jgi:hypothetical protein